MKYLYPYDVCCRYMKYLYPYDVCCRYMKYLYPYDVCCRYMKYLYPYECDKLKLSNPSELQAAIDGNRREGRRSSYGYDLSPGPTLVPSTHPLNGSLINGKMGRGSPGGLSCQ